MAEKRKVYRKTATGKEEQLLKGWADAADVAYDNTTSGTTAENVQDALDEVVSQLDGITGGGVVTGVKGDAESTYRKGNVNITKANIGLGNVDNTSDANKPISTATQTALNLKANTADLGALATKDSLTKTDVGLGNVTNDAQVKRSEMGVANGVATLDTTGKVPSSQLPSYVDDVLEYDNLAAFPTTGEAGKIYVAKDTNKTYRWSGTAYVEISESLALGETTGTAYEGNKGKANADAIAELQTRASNIEAKNNTQDTAIAEAQEAADNAQDTADTAQTTASQAKSTAEDAQDKVDAIIAGTTTVPNAENADAADVATKLAAARKIALSGDVTGETTFDGSADRTIIVTLSNSGVTAGSYSVATFDAKGRATAGGQLIEFGASGATNPSAALAVGGLFFELV